MFLYKNQFLLIFSFLSIPIELWESTATIFRQSSGYVFSILFMSLSKAGIQPLSFTQISLIIEWQLRTRIANVEEVESNFQRKKTGADVHKLHRQI